MHGDVVKKSFLHEGLQQSSFLSDKGELAAAASITVTSGLGLGSCRGRYSGKDSNGGRRVGK